MKFAVVMVGCAGSGKSTYTKIFKDHLKNKFGCNPVIVSRDLIREELGYVKPGEKALLDPLKEEEVTKVWWEKAKDSDVIIIDDTNTNAKFRLPMLKNLRELGFYISGYRINSNLETVKSRRPEFPENVLVSMLEGAKEVKKEDGFDSLRDLNN